MNIEQTVALSLPDYAKLILKTADQFEDKVSLDKFIAKLKEVAPDNWGFKEGIPRHLESDLISLQRKGFINYEDEKGVPITEIRDGYFLTEEEKYVKLHPFGAALISYIK